MQSPLKIRAEQMFALRRSAEMRFRDRVAVHLRRYFPRETEGLDDAALRARVADIVRHARSHGLRGARDLMRYAGVVTAHEVVYGMKGEPDWMRRILDDPEIPDPGQRTDRLAHAGIARLKAAAKALDDRMGYYHGDL